MMKARNILLALMALGLLHSCKKENSDETPVKAPDCKIVTVTDKSGTSSITYNLYYNSNDQISKVERIGSYPSVSFFTYSTDKTVITKVDSSGTTTSETIVTLNEDGMIAEVDVTYYPSNDNNVTTYQYDGSGELLKSTEVYNGGNPETVIYEYTDGNVTSMTEVSSSDETTLEYHLDKKWQTGDYYQFVQFFNYGAYYLKNKNLLKVLSATGLLANIDYEYDADGKITKVLITQGAIEGLLTYQWSCE